MGMYVWIEERSFYKENGKLYNGPDKKVEYEPDTLAPVRLVPRIERPIEVEKPPIEETVIILGATKEELEGMKIQEIYKRFGIKPRKGFTKAKLIEEILGATE